MSKNKKKKDTTEDITKPELLVSETEEQMLEAEALCPKCGKPVLTHKCRLCGSTKSISSVSGNVIWMLNGRVVAAFRDSRRAYTEMANRHGIPQNEWPKEYRD